MRGGEIEETRIPRNPLDVLAQQIVAIVAEEEIEVSALHELVRGAYPFSDLSRTQLENVLDMLAGRYPSDEFAELRPRIVWDRTGRRDPRPHRRAAARGHERRHDPRPRPLRRPPRRRRRPRRRARRGDGLRGARGPDVHARRLDLADRGDHARPRDRLAGAGRARRGAVLAGRGRRAAVRARASDRRARRASSSRSERRGGARAAARRVPPRRARRAQPARVPARAGRGDRRRAHRPHDRGRALPRRDRRLARLHPDAVRRPRARALGDGARRRGCASRSGSRSQSIWSDDGIVLHLPDADAPPTDRRPADRPGRDRGARRRRGRPDGALRLPLPRERRPRAADPATPPRSAHAALAAAPEGAEAAPGRAQVRLVPDRARDLPRVPAGRLRPAGAEGDPARAADARARPGRGRDAPRRRPSRARSSSTTSPPTCTRTTRRRRSGGRRRSRSTATCCASCSARRSCAS